MTLLAPKAHPTNSGESRRAGTVTQDHCASSQRRIVCPARVCRFSRLSDTGQQRLGVGEASSGSGRGLSLGRAGWTWGSGKQVSVASGQC